MFIIRAKIKEYAIKILFSPIPLSAGLCMFKTIYQLFSVFNWNAKKPILSNQVKNTHQYLLFYC